MGTVLDCDEFLFDNNYSVPLAVRLDYITLKKARLTQLRESASLFYINVVLNEQFAHLNQGEKKKALPYHYFH